MKKNLIYTVAINHDTSQFKNTDYSQYCLMSWEKWCKKRNIDFLVIDTHETNFKYPHWDKYTIFNHIDNEYEKIGLVDSDTMIHWEAPNPFDLYNDEWCWVKDLSNLRWTSKSIENYNRFYPEEKLDIYDYYNSGVCFFTKEQLFLMVLVQVILNYPRLKFNLTKKQKLKSYHHNGICFQCTKKRCLTTIGKMEMIRHRFS